MCGSYREKISRWMIAAAKKRRPRETRRFVSTVASSCHTPLGTQWDTWALDMSRGLLPNAASDDGSRVVTVSYVTSERQVRTRNVFRATAFSVPSGARGTSGATFSHRNINSRPSTNASRMNRARASVSKLLCNGVQYHAETIIESVMRDWPGGGGGKRRGKNPRTSMRERDREKRFARTHTRTERIQTCENTNTNARVGKKKKNPRLRDVRHAFMRQQKPYTSNLSS